ncbi:MAG: lipopolysaccharide biosynthesis protein [Burkholderiaceae bacterium]
MSTGTLEAEAGQPMRRSVVSLSMVNAIDMAAQFLMPMLLVRLLSDADFGVYRALWLVAGTGIGILGFAVPASLYYFVPRLSRGEAAVFVRQAGVYMAVAGTLGALAAALWCSWQSMAASSGLGFALFVGLWVFASLLDTLFSAQQRALDQARLNLLFALLRVGLVLGVALQWSTWEAVLIAHLVLAAGKGAACLLAVWRFSSTGARSSRQTVLEHARYVAPFGVSSAMYLLRGRIDQWLVVSLFSAAQFGLYSVAAVFSPIQGLFRATLNQVVLPEMNRLQSAGDLSQMQGLNRRGNLAMGLLMFPTLAFIASRTEPLLSLLFTADYSAAAPVVRTYCVVLFIESIEVTMILTAMRQGGYMMRTDALTLPIVILVSWLAAQEFGLTGAALGGVAGAVVAQSAAFWRACAVTDTRLRDIQNWSALARIGLACLPAAGLVSFVRGLPLAMPLAESPWLAMIFDGLLFTLVYWIGLHLLRLRSEVGDALGARLARLLGFAVR